MERLDQVLADAPASVGAADDLETLARIESELMGKRSLLAEMRRGLRDVPSDERPALGAALSEAQSSLRKLIEDRRVELEVEAENRLLADDHLDMTMGKLEFRRGRHHLITQVMNEVVDIFSALGYRIVTGPEVETSWYNFDALNTPATHPARAESDTFYVEWGDPADGMLLRPQTSPMQVRYMQEHDPPLHVVVPGRVFRTDTLDARRSPIFHQIEGLVVDTDITLADLKGTLAHFAREFFGEGRRLRLLPHFFPFTEPSAEMHVSCFACDGSGCRVCGGRRWLELMGCGMVDPNVFLAVGYDPDEVTGFAFGMGAERLAMVRHGVNHIRHFFENDTRVLGQFV